MIDDDLNKSKLAEVFNLSEQKGIKDRHEVEEADKVIKIIGQRDEKEFFFRDLKKEGNGEEKGKDDDPT
jgi:hypothetical protein